MAAALLLLLAGPALASDAAETAPLGYSADGRYFAYEEFGIQDGSGFPYSSIYVLDLDANAWVAGSPIDERLEDEAATLGAAHSKAIAAAGPVLSKHKITEPAFVLASTPATEVQEARNSVTFDPFYRNTSGSSPVPAADLWASRYTLKAESTVISPVPDHCKDYGEEVMALTVTLTDLKSGTTKTVHQDKAIPKSRGCPTGYDIDKVMVPSTVVTPTRFVALIGVYSFGFEGLNRFTIAIPVVPD